MKSLNKYSIISLVLLVLVLIVQLVPFTHSTKLQSKVEAAGLTWAQLPNSTKIPGKFKSDWPSEIKFKNVEQWVNASKAKEEFSKLATSSDKISVINAVIETLSADYYAEDFVAALTHVSEEASANPAVLTQKVQQVKGTAENGEPIYEYVDYLDHWLKVPADDYFTFLKVYPLYGEKQISIFTYVWNPAGALSGFQVNCFVLLQVLFIAFALFAFLVKNYMAKAVVAIMFGLSHIYAFVNVLILKANGDLVPYMPVAVLLLVLGFAAIAVGCYFIPEYKREKKANAELKKTL